MYAKHPANGIRFVYSAAAMLSRFPSNGPETVVLRINVFNLAVDRHFPTCGLSQRNNIIIWRTKVDMKMEKSWKIENFREFLSKIRKQPVADSRMISNSIYFSNKIKVALFNRIYVIFQKEKFGRSCVQLVLLLLL